MREIKFRGKRIDDGNWVEGGFHEHVKRTPCPIGDSIQAEDIAYFIIKSGFSDWNMPKPIQGYEVDPETVCQYTGLKDKNGKLIFEGDIIVSDEYPFFSDGGIKYVGVVEWIHSSWQSIKHCVSTSIRGISDGVNDYIDNGSGVMEFRVIGNRWDNPELLGQTND